MIERLEKMGYQLIFIVALMAHLLVSDQSTALEKYTVILNGLDKVTGRISTIKVNIGQTVVFGTFAITPRFCEKKPPVERPETAAFLEIVETRGNREKLFSGWMFASSPGLSAVSHPVYDVWVKDCLPYHTPSTVPAE